MKNKGQMGVGFGIVSLVALAFFILLMVGTLLYVFGVVDSSISGGNIVENGYNISNASMQTVGQVNEGFLNSADLIAILMIFGIILSIFVLAYLLRDTTPILFFVIDFIIIIFAYILAVYVSNAYESILTSLPYATTITANMSNASALLLNLPAIIVVTGAIAMIIAYAGITRVKEVDVGGL